MRGRLLLLAGLFTCLSLLVASTALGGAGTVTGDKTLNKTDIACDGSVDVTVTLNAQTRIAGNPADIELVLDRSGSMAGTPLADLKTAANAFVDKIDEATERSLDGVIANGSRVGVVSFSGSATLDVPLTTNANTVHSGINALVANGSTNHAAAFNTAQADLAGSVPTNAKKLIMFTDGQSNVGGNAQPEAAAARAAGTEIFAIGLGSVNVAQLNGWATDPDASHVFIAPSSSDLNAIFNAIGAAILVPAANNITVVDTVAGHFSISNEAVSKGTLTKVGNVLTWTIGQLNTESATLTFTGTHDATQAGGVEQVDSSITYTDDEGHVVSFPNPSVNVRGCAAAISLSPAVDTNELVPGATHTVTATVTDDFGDPVNGIPVSFGIGVGPNTGATGSGTTAGAGATPFTYPAAQGLAGLGTDIIKACFTNGQGASICAKALKRWQDTTPPAVSCTPTTNPSGGNVPPAGNNPKSGQNPDGFYLLGAKDLVDPNPQIFVSDSVPSFVSNAFANGDKMKLTQAPGATPSDKRPEPGVITSHVTLKGDALVYAVDASGNKSAPISCKVPPPPK